MEKTVALAKKIAAKARRPYLMKSAINKGFDLDLESAVAL